MNFDLDFHTSLFWHQKLWYGGKIYFCTISDCCTVSCGLEEADKGNKKLVITKFIPAVNRKYAFTYQLDFRLYGTILTLCNFTQLPFM